MFGESLLIAPVIQEGMTSRIVKLPKGTWVDFWSHSIVQGGQSIHVNAEVIRFPCLSRKTLQSY